MTEDNSELRFVSDLARGDAAALRAFDVRCRPLIGHALGVALRRWRPESPVQPEDLTQDFVGFLFLDGGRRLRSFEGRSPFPAWLYTVALRYFQRRLSRLAPDRRAAGDCPELAASDEHDPERALEAAQSAARVRAAVETLPPDDRLLVRLFFVEGLNAAEVAQTLGRGPSAVRMKKMRLLERLRSVLGLPSEAPVDTAVDAGVDTAKIGAGA